MLPVALGDLTEFVKLSAHGNQLLAIPSRYQRLQKLRVLHLSGNHLCKFPTHICSLGQLEEVYLDANKSGCLRAGLDDPQLHKLTSLAVYA